MKIKYHKQIVNILYNEWDLGKISSKAKGKTCAWIYWFEILSEVQKIILEKENDNIIGMCGYTKFNSKKYILRKKFYTLLRKLLIHSFLVKNKDAIYKYDNAYDYLPKEIENKYDGEIKIIIIEKNFRGLNIGNKLLNNAFKLANLDNMNKIYILSDESCNYKFYESLGCKKIYEKIIPNSEPDKYGKITTEKGFAYEKNLKN